MTLTNDDLQAINDITQQALLTQLPPLIKATVQPMIDEAVDSLAQSTAAGFAEVHEKLAEHDLRFEQIDQQFVVVRTDLNRIENKLDATIDRVDDHEARLRKLEAKRLSQLIRNKG